MHEGEHDTSRPCRPLGTEPIAAADFYEKVVGLEPVRVTEFAAGTVPFPSVRLNDETLLDLMPLAMAERMKWSPAPPTARATPSTMSASPCPPTPSTTLRTRLEARAVPVSDFSYDSFGARGPARRSFYFRDPDGNVFEARHYD